MKKFLKIVAFLIMTLGFAVPAQAAAGLIDYPVEGTEYYSMAYEAAELFNEEREAIGVNRLEIDADLTEAAMLRAYEIAVYTSHVRPNGTMANSDLCEKITGENIGFGVVPTAEAFKDSIMSSPGHKSTAMSSKANLTGIGCAKIGSGTYLWVQLMGQGEANQNLVTEASVYRTRNVQCLTGNLIFYKPNLSNVKYGTVNDSTIRSRIAVELSGGYVPGAPFAADRLFFDSSDESVFTVNSRGVVVPTGVGTATLTYTLRENPTVTNTQEVTVKAFTLGERLYPEGGGIAYDSSTVVIDGKTEYEYTGSEVRPKVVVKDCNGNTLSEGRDYILSYSSNTDPGTGKVTVTGIGNYDGADYAEFQITKPVMPPSPTPSQKPTATPTPTVKPTPSPVPTQKTDLSKGKLTLSSTSFTCTGKVIKPKATIKYGTGTLKEGTDYTLAYSNNLNPGTGKVTATGIGQYKGSLSATFQISLSTPKLKSATALSSKEVKVSWNKVPGAQGYNLYYKANGSGWVCVAKKIKGTSITNSGLQSGTKYTYTVRAVYGNILSGYDKKGLSVTTKGTSSSVPKNATGVIKATVNGVNGWWNFKNGKVVRGVTVAKNKNGWWYIDKNGKVDFSANTIAKNKNGWWVIRDGKVDFHYNGLATNQNGTYKITKGKVTFKDNGVVKIGKKWYRLSKSKVIKKETVAKNKNGWWYIDKNGTVDFKANTVAKNSNGWWVIQNGKVNFRFTGIAKNKNGTWYVKNGKVDFKKNGTVRYAGAKYRIKNGKASKIS